MTQPGSDVASPPPLDLSQETAGEWVVVHVSGEIDAASAPSLRECVVAATASGTRRLILDLSAVSSMDSSALAVLVGTHKRLQTLDGHLRLVVPSPENLRLLKITSLHRVFEVFPSLSAALEE